MAQGGAGFGFAQAGLDGVEVLELPQEPAGVARGAALGLEDFAPGVGEAAGEDDGGVAALPALGRPRRDRRYSRQSERGRPIRQG